MTDLTIPLPRRLAIWDPAALNDRDGAQAVAALQRPEFGWDALALRDRHCFAAPETWRFIAATASRAGIPIWLNRQPLLLQTLNAAGLIVGAGELPGLDRQGLGGRPIVASVHNRAEADLAQAHDVAAVLFGHIRSTPSKRGLPAVGWSGLAAFAADTRLPVIAIGGLQHDMLAEARRNGASGIAAIRAPFAVVPASSSAV